MDVEAIDKEDYIIEGVTEEGDDDEEDAEKYEELVAPELGLELQEYLDVLSDHIAESRDKQNDDPHHQIHHSTSIKLLCIHERWGHEIRVTVKQVVEETGQP